jgi:hypothetical protein
MDIFPPDDYARPALCTNKDCRNVTWYYPDGGFDKNSGEPIPRSEPHKCCRKCGRPMLSACPNCNRPLDMVPPPRRTLLREVRYKPPFG